jgi:hypothetical protein
MRIQTLLAGAAMALIASASAVSANAAVTLISTQAAFSAAGTITQNTNWDASPAGFSFPGSPFTVGELTFVEGSQNLIGDTPGAGYNTARPLLTDDGVAGTTIEIAGQHDLFAFDLGNFFSTGAADLAVVTNLGIYSFSPTVNSAANLGALTFVGLQADAGEYFTSVRYSGQNATGATDIQLGTAVPEPTSWALMLTGFLGAGAALRSSRRRTVAAATA